jgi:hypothetical protein
VRSSIARKQRHHPVLGTWVRNGSIGAGRSYATRTTCANAAASASSRTWHGGEDGFDVVLGCHCVDTETNGAVEHRRIGSFRGEQENRATDLGHNR